MTKLEELRDLLQEKSIRHGEFVLASGARSQYYCDTKATVLSPRGSRLIGETLFEELDERRVEAVGGLAMGATFIATAVAMASDQHESPIYGYTVRNSQKEHGLERSVEESYHPDGEPLLSPGRRVAVVDDVVTGGGSILQAIETVEERGCEIVAVVAIVDRRQGGGDRLCERGLPYFSLFEAGEQGHLSIVVDRHHSEAAL